MNKKLIAILVASMMLLSSVSTVVYALADSPTASSIQPLGQVDKQFALSADIHSMQRANDDMKDRLTEQYGFTTQQIESLSDATEGDSASGETIVSTMNFGLSINGYSAQMRGTITFNGTENTFEATGILRDVVNDIGNTVYIGSFSGNLNNSTDAKDMITLTLHFDENTQNVFIPLTLGSLMDQDGNNAIRLEYGSYFEGLESAVKKYGENRGAQNNEPQFVPNNTGFQVKRVDSNYNYVNSILKFVNARLWK